MALIGDFLRAVAQMTDRRFVWVLLKSLGLTITLLIAAAAAAGWALSFVPTDLGKWWLVGEVALPVTALQSLGVLAVLGASAFLMIPVAAVFLGFFLEEIAGAVESRHYPALPDPRTTSLLANIAASVRFTVLVVVLNFGALIVYLFSGPFAPFIFYALNGYLLGREYFEMVAARHLSIREAADLRKRNFFRSWLAGLLMAVPLTIPVLNLVVPVLGVATITHQFHRLWAASRP